MTKIVHVFIFSCILFFACDHEKHQLDYLISDVNIVDINTGTIINSQSVGIKDGRITGIYDQPIAVDTSTVVIDGDGKFLIPGLWDMHAHYYWNHDYTDPLLIANGITGIREMWGQMDSIRVLRNKGDSGELIPHIYSAGELMDGDPPYWKDSRIVAEASQAREAVKEQVMDGVDFIKVYSLLSRDAYFAIADECSKQAISFAGHIPEKVTIHEAVNAGQKSAEHMFGVLEAVSGKPDLIDSFKAASRNFFFSEEYLIALTKYFDESKSDSLSRFLAKNDLWLCPTLTEIRGFGISKKDTTFTKDTRLNYVHNSLTEFWPPSDDMERHAMAYKEFANITYRLLGKMNKAGVKIIAGTDFPNPYCLPGFGLHDELQLMVACGLTPAEALKTATINPAVFMNKEKDFGSIDVGKIASIVMLNDNPLLDISNTTNIRGVMLRGRWVNYNQLRKLLDKQISK